MLVRQNEKENMEREEKFIEDKFGRRTPFRVPEGYFDDFASQLMQSLPDQVSAPVAKVVPMGRLGWRRARPFSIAAASVCAVIFGWGVYSHGGKSSGSSSVDFATHTTVGSNSYSTVDAMADYTMLDTEDMYAYLEDTK